MFIRKYWWTSRLRKPTIKAIFEAVWGEITPEFSKNSKLSREELGEPRSSSATAWLAKSMAFSQARWRLSRRDSCRSKSAKIWFCPCAYTSRIRWRQVSRLVNFPSNLLLGIGKSAIEEGLHNGLPLHLKALIFGKNLGLEVHTKRAVGAEQAAARADGLEF